LSGYRYDAILLDLKLADSVGLDTIGALASLAGCTPIVVLTGDEAHTGREALRAGAQGFLPKNELTPALVWRAVEHAIERQQLVASRRSRFAAWGRVMQSLSRVSGGGRGLSHRNPAAWGELKDLYAMLSAEHAINGGLHTDAHGTRAALIRRLHSVLASTDDVVSLHIATQHSGASASGEAEQILLFEVIGYLLATYRDAYANKLDEVTLRVRARRN
ncbi:MAG: hypothetical protein ACI9WU_004977, partial [Myxococcota bacterium]